MKTDKPMKKKKILADVSIKNQLNNIVILTEALQSETFTNLKEITISCWL